MGKSLPKSRKPPVVETVLSLQFEPLAGYTDAQAGIFAERHLGKDWCEFRAQAPLQSQFERFGEEQTWRPPGGLNIRSGTSPSRTQIIRRDQKRMIQIQDTRFIYNWRKEDAPYPSFEQIRDEFLEKAAAFRDFLQAIALGDPILNQWEITYVNQIAKGDLWRDPGDWSEVLTGWQWPADGVSDLTVDTASSQWTMRIGNDLGRLHVELSHGRIGSPDGEEAMILKLTARGPVTEGADSWENARAGLEQGRISIVRAFWAMTTAKAHQAWERYQ